LGACAGEELKTKNARIKREVKILAKIFEKVEENRRKSAEKLIDRAAFMLILLEDMEEQIKREGLIVTMQQGDYTIERAHPLLEKHVAMAKNYAMVCKQLEGLLPEPTALETEAGKRLADFVAERKTG